MQTESDFQAIGDVFNAPILSKVTQCIFMTRYGPCPSEMAHGSKWCRIHTFVMAHLSDVGCPFPTIMKMKCCKERCHPDSRYCWSHMPYGENEGLTIPTCEHVFIRGVRKGQACGLVVIDSKVRLCATHLRRK